ncbi:MAG: Ig-like domain-containing protein [Paracoccaceae bacterium]|nr:Ig-like domain-containing protein [Paracoccaceae bacterium]
MANQAPIAQNDLYQVFEDERNAFSPAQGVLNNDSDPDGDKLAVSVSSANRPLNPLFDINTNGAFTYDTRYHGDLWVDGTHLGTPGDPAPLVVSGDVNAVLLDNGFNSLADGAVITDTFTYTLFDGQAFVTATATIEVTGVNDDPVAVDDELIVGAGLMDTIDVILNDTDVDVWPTPDVLTVASISDVNDPGPDTGESVSGSGTEIDPLMTDAGGSVFIDASGNIKYTAATGFFGIDTIQYTVSDGNGGTDTGELRVTVTPANQDPTAVDDSYMIGEDDGATAFATVLGNDSDPDGGDDLGAQLGGLVLTRIDNPTDMNTIGGDPGILVDFNVDGTFTYNPNGQFENLAAGESAYVAFEYDAFDAEGTPSRAKVIIEIQGANDPILANLPGQMANVYEAGLVVDPMVGQTNAGSGIGLTTTMQTFSYLAGLAALKTDAVANPDGDTIFLAPTVTGTTPLEADATAMPGDTIAGVDGFWTLLDTGDNATGQEGAAFEDGLIDAVKFTFTNNNTGHSDDGQDSGLNEGLIETLQLGLTDGTLVSGGSNYQVQFGSNFNITSAEVVKIDDIPVLDPTFTVGTILIDETTGIQAGTNDVADPGAGQREALASGIITLADTVTSEGADGLESGPTTELTDSTGANFNGTATNLFDTATGNRIFLYDNGGNGVVGRVGTGTGTGDANAGGDIAFTIALENEVDARLTQDRAVFHADATNPDDTVTLTAADGSALIFITVTVNDGDVGATDEVKATGNNALVATFRDDKPLLTSIEEGFVDWVVDTYEGAATGLDFGFDGAGFVDLTSFSASVQIFDTDGVLITTVTGTESPDNTVLYEDAMGVDFFELRLDSATGNFEFEIFEDAPLVENQVNLGGVKAGAPTGRVEFTTATATVVGINAIEGVADVGNDDDGPLPNPSDGDVKDAIDAGDATALLNASSNGLGTENQNTEDDEAYVIDTSVPTGGVVFTVGKGTGGIDSVSFNWEAYDVNGDLVAEGTTTAVAVPSGGNSNEVRIELPAGVEASFYYLNPDISGGGPNAAFNIPTLSILERGAVDDFEFLFSAQPFDKDGDPADLADDFDFVVGVNADGNITYDGTTSLVNELDMA